MFSISDLTLSRFFLSPLPPAPLWKWQSVPCATAPHTSRPTCKPSRIPTLAPSPSSWTTSSAVRTRLSWRWWRTAPLPIGSWSTASSSCWPAPSRSSTSCRNTSRSGCGARGAAWFRPYRWVVGSCGCFLCVCRAGSTGGDGGLSRGGGPRACVACSLISRGWLPPTKDYRTIDPGQLNSSLSYHTFNGLIKQHLAGSIDWLVIELVIESCLFFERDSMDYPH